MTGSVQGAIEEAIRLRNSGEPDEALTRLRALHELNPDHSELNLQMAWTLDGLGEESEAVRFYETALSGDLGEDNAIDALLGLGSTLRALGRYREAASILNDAVRRFPNDRALQVFDALALYNVGKAKQACESLLRLLIETTSDKRIQTYRSALSGYAADLDRTW